MSIEKQILVDQIKKINNPDAVRKFFSLLNELIEVVNLPNSSRKIAFTISRNSLKISAFINAHAALQLSGRKEKVSIGLLFKNEILQRKAFPITKLQLKEKPTHSKYIFGQISVENKHLLENQTVLQAWTDCLSELENTASSSQQRSSHNTFLYEVAESQALRQEFFQEIFQHKK